MAESTKPTIGEVVPTGGYPVKCVACEIAPDRSGRDEPDTGYQLGWTFELLDGEWAGRQFTAFSSCCAAARSKYRQWAAALGVTVEDGQTLYPERMVGLQGNAYILCLECPDASEYNYITNIRPIGYVEQSRPPASKRLCPGLRPGWQATLLLPVRSSQLTSRQIDWQELLR